jgi:hypothetical protein
VRREEYEKAHIDILSVITQLTCSKDKIESEAHGWSELHDAVFTNLVETGHITRTDEGLYKIASPKQRRKETIPYSEPLATIYREGTVSGCHDNGLFALVSFYAFQDLSWEQTKTELKHWYIKTGMWDDQAQTWNRDGIDEPDPETIISKKKHVWEEGYGWSEKGNEAKKVIDRHNPQSRRSQQIRSRV